MPKADPPRVPNRVTLMEFYGFTDFDMHVLRRAADGATVTATAAMSTGYGPDMVKLSRKKIIATLHATNITNAVWLALEKGLLEPPKVWIPVHLRAKDA